MGDQHRWPITARINQAVCPRCGGNHGEIEYRRFELGDARYTHWAYCESTGEPLLINMERRQQKVPDKFLVRFAGTGKKASFAPNPQFPDGVDLVPQDVIQGQPMCKVKLPYPAAEVGAWKVECTECGARIACTAAGRPDDPKSIAVPCKKGVL